MSHNKERKILKEEKQSIERLIETIYDGRVKKSLKEYWGAAYYMQIRELIDHNDYLSHNKQATLTKADIDRQAQHYANEKITELLKRYVK